MGMSTDALVEGRICGSCTLCCKLFPVPELNKAAGRWCPHVQQGRGCTIHASRPKVCRTFHCQWLYHAELGPEWKPERAKFVLSIYPGSQSLAVTVDPAEPLAWMREPYYRNLKSWATAAVERGEQVVVFNGRAATIVLPERDVALGVLEAGDSIVVRRTNGAWGPRFDAVVRRSPAGAASA
jgi:hypothetical protein